MTRKKYLILYIPLRSDKTSHDQPRQSQPSHFISHYVQIKPLSYQAGNSDDLPFISHYVQIKLADWADWADWTDSLYPTTFR